MTFDIPMGGPPHKCPECGVWWVGLEHRCQYPIKETERQRIAEAVKGLDPYVEHGTIMRAYLSRAAVLALIEGEK
ncbi:MAG: hypothetical protein V1912_11345 [bacterium]